jgi:hypothetical protein
MARIPDKMAAAMTMAGNAATPKLDKNSASRVALPAS